MKVLLDEKLPRRQLSTLSQDSSSNAWVLTGDKFFSRTKGMVRKRSFWLVVILWNIGWNLYLTFSTIDQNPVTSGKHRGFWIPFLGGSKNTLHPRIPESVIWHQLLNQSVPSTAVCESFKAVQSPSKDTTKNLRASGSLDLLPILGFRRDVMRFLEATNRTDPTMANSFRGSAGPGNSTMLISDARKKCYLPSPTYCDQQSYSVVVYSRALNPRRLLLNLMAFQSYPSASQLTLVLPSPETLVELRKDTMYGSRIYHWAENGVIRVVHEPSLWDSLEQLRTNESAVLWVNGDTRKNWNGTLLRSGLRRWRQSSRSLVFSDTTPVPAFSTSPSPHLGGCFLNRLHVTFMHRGWLCFLRHRVVDTLRGYLRERNDWEETMDALSILWNSLGDGHILPSPLESLGGPSANAFAIEGEDAERFPRTAAVVNYFGCCTITTSNPRATNHTCNKTYG